MVNRQIRQVEKERARRIRQDQKDPAVAADADRRWLLALGQNENQEAASHRQPRPQEAFSEDLRREEVVQSEFSEEEQGK